MFGRIRRLEISLAAKCQILFGAAVVLIIAAALLVPWQRMEQLTEQLDERAAAALADDELARHVAEHGGAAGSAAASAVPALAPTTSSADDAAGAVAEDDPASDTGRSRTRSRWRLLTGSGGESATDDAGDANPEPPSNAAAPKNDKPARGGRRPTLRPPAARLLAANTAK